MAVRGPPGRGLRPWIAAMETAGAVLFPWPVAAGPLAKPGGGEIVLTISGAIANSNGDGNVFLDLALLKTLPARRIVTETPWTKGPHTFTGVPLEMLMEWVGAKGETITAGALNDYSVELPIDDGPKHG